jgi:carbonic anhydrase
MRQALAIGGRKKGAVLVALAVVFSEMREVLLEEGKNNPLIRELWNDLPKEKEKEEVLDTVTINVENLLPADPGYYTFSGSLTTPPCSENVTWFVLKHTVAITAEEIEQFSKLYRHDARPTPPLYDRVVLESK